ncbi:MAG: dicarboxylate/amino acid:cation symporter, partial [Acidimicrobiales bacterium]
MWTFLRARTLTQWILFAMALGTFVGWAAPDSAAALRPLSTIFLRMIKSIIVPLIFGTLVVGIAGHGDDLKRVGRLALKSIIYFEIVTTLALVIGLVAVNLTRPGVGVGLEAPAATGEQLAGQQTTLAGILTHVVPQSFFEAAVHNEVLQVVFWSILFAVALTQVRGRSKEFMLHACEALTEVMFKFTGIVMKYAPIGIGAAIAVTVGHS